MQPATNMERAHYLITRLNIALDTARLAALFARSGKLKEAAKQQAIAEREYQACMGDWEAFQMDIHAEDALRQTRDEVERCLSHALHNVGLASRGEQGQRDMHTQPAAQTVPSGGPSDSGSQS